MKGQPLMQAVKCRRYCFLRNTIVTANTGVRKIDMNEFVSDIEPESLQL